MNSYDSFPVMINLYRIYCSSLRCDCIISNQTEVSKQVEKLYNKKNTYILNNYEFTDRKLTESSSYENDTVSFRSVFLLEFAWKGKIMNVFYSDVNLVLYE